QLMLELSAPRTAVETAVAMVATGPVSALAAGATLAATGTGTGTDTDTVRALTGTATVRERTAAVAAGRDVNRVDARATDAVRCALRGVAAWVTGDDGEVSGVSA
ncbi:MAG: hypothetical protein ACOYEV_19280, partial [Candidatus Nanopelagicales bacterium]